MFPRCCPGGENGYVGRRSVSSRAGDEKVSPAYAEPAHRSMMGFGAVHRRFVRQNWRERGHPDCESKAWGRSSSKYRRSSAKLKHDAEKAWPGRDPGWVPVSRKSLPSGLTRGIMLQA